MNKALLTRSALLKFFNQEIYPHSSDHMNHHLDWISESCETSTKESACLAVLVCYTATHDTDFGGANDGHSDYTYLPSS